MSISGIGKIKPLDPSSRFAEIVQEITWSSAAGVMLPSNIRVAQELGWLVHVVDEAASSVIGFSVESAGEPALPPPESGREAARRARLAEVTGRPFNSDFMAKGTGSTIANTPEALQPHSLDGLGYVAVRSVSLSGPDNIWRSSERDDPLARHSRIIRHGGLFVGALIGDLFGDDRGSRAMSALMEQRYADAPLAEMPAPPIWREQQRRVGVVHGHPPRIMLVRGGKYAADNTMMTVGTYPVEEIVAQRQR